MEKLERQIDRWLKRIKTKDPSAKIEPLILQANLYILTQAKPKDSAKNKIRGQLLLYVSKNLHARPTLKDFAATMGLSPKYCSNLIKNKLGESFSSFLKRSWVELANKYLAETTIPLCQIAEALGFEDQFSFSHFYKKATGSSPQFFRTKRQKPKS